MTIPVSTTRASAPPSAAGPQTYAAVHQAAFQSEQTATAQPVAQIMESNR